MLLKIEAVSHEPDRERFKERCALFVGRTILQRWESTEVKRTVG
jgi:hypothetical protein